MSGSNGGGKFQDECGGRGAKGDQGGVEAREVGGRDGGNDAGNAFVEGLAVSGAILNAAWGRDVVAGVAEELDG